MTLNNTIKLAFLKFRQIDGIILVEIGVEWEGVSVRSRRQSNNVNKNVCLLQFITTSCMSVDFDLNLRTINSLHIPVSDKQLDRFNFSRLTEYY